MNLLAFAAGIVILSASDPVRRLLILRPLRIGRLLIGFVRRAAVLLSFLDRFSVF